MLHVHVSQVTASRLASTDDDDATASQGAAATGSEAAARARGKLVSQMMKKHLVEAVVPVLVELKRMLTDAKHPLLGELMSCMAAVLRDYKGEIEDILVADKQVSHKRRMFGRNCPVCYVCCSCSDCWVPFSVKLVTYGSTACTKVLSGRHISCAMICCCMPVWTKLCCTGNSVACFWFCAAACQGDLV